MLRGYATQLILRSHGSIDQDTMQALLPLQTDALLASLHRNPKTHRSGSPTHQNSGSISMSSSLNISSMGSSSHPHIDVRTVGLRGFRDQIILPLFQRLYARLSMPNRLLENEGFVEPRCNQMCVFTYNHTDTDFVTNMQDASPCIPNS